MKYISIILLAIFFLRCDQEVVVYNIYSDGDALHAVCDSLLTYEKEIDEIVLRTQAAYFDNKEFLDSLFEKDPSFDLPEEIKDVIFDDMLNDSSIIECKVFMSAMTTFKLSKNNLLDSLPIGQQYISKREKEYNELVRKEEEQHLFIYQPLYLYPRDSTTKIILGEDISQDIKDSARIINDVGSFYKLVMLNNEIGYVQVKLFVDLSGLVSEYRMRYELSNNLVKKRNGR